jgi:N,N'-diacetyllegionaminate synthase
MRSMRIGTREVGPGKPVYIIAEAGVNHNGDIVLAKRLIDVAKDAGADAVKFQTFQADELATNDAPMAAYQERNTGISQTQYEMLRGLTLTDAEFTELAVYARKADITFLSTPHGGFRSVDLLERLRVPAYKIGSADLNNLPLLDYVARTKKPIIISTGMARMQDIAEAVRTIREAGNEKIVILQCTTDYPCPIEHANVEAMRTIAKRFGFPVGFSDHTIGSDASFAAVLLGASVIEKHLTLDHTLKGPDHAASADPDEFRTFVKRVRSAPVILGTGMKAPLPSERVFMPIVFKSVVAARKVMKGDMITKDTLAIKRPARGLPPKYYWRLIGTIAKRDIAKDEYFTKKDAAQPRRARKKRV